MLTLLTKLFIKDYKNYKEPSVRRSYGMLGGILGIILNVFLFAGKYFAGMLSGSIAIMADSFNNLSDAGSSLITLIGFRFAGKKPDPEHPFGHGRVEYLSGLFVSIAIILMGVELAKSSVGKILHPEAVDSSVVAMVILLVSIGVKVYMSIYNRLIGKKINSAALKATATDSLSDSVATAVVLLSMLILKLTGINVDGWCGVLVALFILYAGIGAARETLSPLLGQKPEPEFVEQIERMVMEHEEIMGIHDLIVHDYGPGRVMISLHGEVPGDGDIFELHDAIDCIERELKEQLGCEAVIHMDPIAVNDENVMNLRKEVAILLKKIDASISIHDFRIVTGPTHTNLIFDAVIPFSLSKTEKEVKEMIQQEIMKKWDNYYAVVTIDWAYS